MASARSRYLKFQASVVALQSGFRKRCAKKQLIVLRQVSGDVDGVGRRPEKERDNECAPCVYTLLYRLQRTLVTYNPVMRSSRKSWLA